MTDNKSIIPVIQNMFGGRKMVMTHEDGSHELVPVTTLPLKTPITESERNSLYKFNLILKSKKEHKGKTLAFLVDSLSDENWDNQLLIEYYRQHIKPGRLLRTVQPVGVPITVVTRDWVIADELGENNMVKLQDGASITLVPLLVLLKAGAVNIYKQEVVSKGSYEEEVLRKSAELFVEIDQKTGKAVSLEKIFNSND